MPTTLAPGTRIGSHTPDDAFVILRTYVPFAQLDNLWRRDLPARVESFGDRFDHSALFILPTLEEIEPIAARGWLFSGHNRVKEDLVELADFDVFQNTSICVKFRRMDGLRTFIDVYMRPNVLAFTDVNGFA